MKCNRCKEYIEDMVVVMSFQKKWHENCFSCEISGKKFSDKDPYYIHQGMFLCKDEYYKQTNYYCRTTKKPIEDEVILSHNHCYSNQYFICTRCQKNLRNKAYHTVDDDLYCDTCINEKNFGKTLKNKN